MPDSFFVQLFGARAHLLEPTVTQLGCRTQIIDSVEQLSAAADVCLAWGVYQIVKPRHLRVPRLGLWGFHETALPEGRGCAPLQWTVLSGADRLSVSFFQLVEELDGGPLLAQASIPIERTDLLEDLRAKATRLVIELLTSHLPAFLRGEIQPHPQVGPPTFFRARTPQDSQLDPSRSLTDLWDLIRICDNDAFPAWFEIGGERIVLKRYRARQGG